MKTIINDLIFTFNYRTESKYALELKESIKEIGNNTILTVSLVCSKTDVEICRYNCVITNLTEEDLLLTYYNIYSQLLAEVLYNYIIDRNK